MGLQRVVDNLVDIKFVRFTLSYYVDVLWRGSLSLLLATCCLLRGPPLLDEGDVGLGVIEER